MENTYHIHADTLNNFINIRQNKEYVVSKKVITNIKNKSSQIHKN